MGFRLRTPSPTTVIACIALFLALGGGGYIALAHGGAGAAKKKAKRGPQGPQGPAGPAGAQGPPGAPGTGKAGARVVGSSAAITPGTAFGGIEVAKDATGGYCIRVPFTPVNVVATVTASNRHATAELTSVGGFGICTTLLPGYQAWVTTFDNTDTLSDANFFVLVN